MSQLFYTKLKNIFMIRYWIILVAFSNLILQVYAEEKADSNWWSLQQIKKPEIPKVENKNWVRNPIDNFILAKLEEAGLSPAPEADTRSLTRRLHFDLTGLPPTPGALADIDTLLNSPHYGERWARHWLDVARYGESNGFEYDQLRPNAWTYRDWVIESLNDDMPYDRFARLQIAGDVLEPNNPGAITATGFLVCGAFDGLKPSGDKQRKIMRQDEMEDLVGTVSQAFLGLTVHCARCHDHKFDPIQQKEYYQMASALGGVHRGDRDVPATGNPSLLKQKKELLQQRLKNGDKKIRELILREGRNSKINTVGPKPIARWTFDVDLKDQIGNLHGKAMNGAKINDGALELDGKAAYVMTSPIQSDIKAKTLESWVKLNNLNQRGGAAMSLQSNDGKAFDAIVFGEREPNRWMAGSEGYSRTQSFGGEEENKATDQFIHIAIVYHEDGTIKGYRDGKPYGKSYKSESLKVNSGNFQVLFGMRHGTKASNDLMLNGKIDRSQLYDRALTAEEIALSSNGNFVSEDEIIAKLRPEQRVVRERWKAEITRIDNELSKTKKRKVYAVKPSKAPVTHLLVRGSPFELGDKVSAGGVSSVTGSMPSNFGLNPDAPDAERRKKLALWISAPDNPLFARVIVNRLWHYHFGKGLVQTTNDLGFNGGIPSHPNLLDWLAAELKEKKWSLKAIHRLICSSATYRQSSQENPKAQSMDSDNLLLWKRSISRLEAELIRDSILTVSGQLNKKMGGAGYRDFKMYNHKGSWVYDATDPEGPEFNRRSIYRTWARGNVHPLLAPLDCPDPSASTPVRSITTTPLGALSMMNTSFVLRMSRKFAERLKAEVGTNVGAQVKLGFELAFLRVPKENEQIIIEDFVKKNGLPALCRVLINSNEFIYLN
ncbi:MAG: hypothetical protein CMO46_10930 [Verrucomicrobiales bacterium]|nr:hypothetical protein [Verrucomicrobiales bacterium]|tara:strand:+ start:4472 stop:7135 length:2664 start_codon:yes stop_codon:yes gene_type:complete